jgi:hypothetical protein
MAGEGCGKLGTWKLSFFSMICLAAAMNLMR